MNTEALVPPGCKEDISGVIGGGWVKEAKIKVFQIAIALTLDGNQEIGA